MKKLLFLGDSITDCEHSFDTENLGDGYVRMIAKELESNKVTVKNMGMNGFTISALKRLWNIQCTTINPDFITILIGINDIAVVKNTGKDYALALLEFEKNYEILLKQIQIETKCPILLMEPFIFPHPAVFSTWIPKVRKMNEIIQKMAVTHGVGFLPLWDKLNKAVQTHGYHAITLDGVHLTSQGHRIIAGLWLDYYIKNGKSIL